MGYYKTKRDFHEARWDEPIIMKLGNPAGSKGRSESYEGGRNGSKSFAGKLDPKESTETSGDVSDASAQTLYEIVSGDNRNRS